MAALNFYISHFGISFYAIFFFLTIMNHIKFSSSITRPSIEQKTFYYHLETEK